MGPRPFSFSAHRRNSYDARSQTATLATANTGDIATRSTKPGLIVFLILIFKKQARARIFQLCGGVLAYTNLIT